MLAHSIPSACSQSQRAGVISRARLPEGSSRFLELHDEGSPVASALHINVLDSDQDQDQ